MLSALYAIAVFHKSKGGYMGYLPATGAYMIIALAIGFIVMVVGLFVGHIILFDKYYPRHYRWRMLQSLFHITFALFYVAIPFPFLFSCQWTFPHL